MNPLNYPTDNMYVIAALAAAAWIALAALIAAMMQQPNDGE